MSICHNCERLKVENAKLRTLLERAMPTLDLYCSSIELLDSIERILREPPNGREFEDIHCRES